MTRATHSILFVCLGNICRSPLAEGVFYHLVEQLPPSSTTWKIESAGTAGYHVGSQPDERSTEVGAKHGVKMRSVCRKLSTKDFDEFDIIVGMDKMNMKNIEAVRPKGSHAKVVMFGSYGDKRQIDDPYYGGAEGFEQSYQQCLAYSKGLLKDLGF